VAGYAPKDLREDFGLDLDVTENEMELICEEILKFGRQFPQEVQERKVN